MGNVKVEFFSSKKIVVYQLSQFIYDDKEDFKTYTHNVF